MRDSEKPALCRAPTPTPTPHPWSSFYQSPSGLPFLKITSTEQMRCGIFGDDCVFSVLSSHRQSVCTHRSHTWSCHATCIVSVTESRSDQVFLVHGAGTCWIDVLACRRRDRYGIIAQMKTILRTSMSSVVAYRCSDWRDREVTIEWIEGREGWGRVGALISREWKTRERIFDGEPIMSLSTVREVAFNRI